MGNFQFKVDVDVNFNELGYSVLDKKVNFGDLLLREAAEILFDLDSIKEKFAGAIFGGSVISDYYMRRLAKLELSKEFLFHACGVRVEDFDSSTLSPMLNLAGVRGPYSQRTTQVDAVGDPGVLSPVALDIWPTLSPEPNILFIPHFLDSARLKDSRTSYRNVQLKRGVSTKGLLQEIAEADFVIAGAMHAGIAAYALGTPFSFYKKDFVDVELKYGDFSDFYGIPYGFHSGLNEAINFYLNHADAYATLQPEKISCVLDPMSEFLTPAAESITELLPDYLSVRHVVHKIKVGRLSRYLK